MAVRKRLTAAGGFERECCGEDRATGGMPRAGLVPVPLPPANYTQTNDFEVKSEKNEQK